MSKRTHIALVGSDGIKRISGTTAAFEKLSIADWTRRLRASYVRRVLSTLDRDLHELTVKAIEKATWEGLEDTRLQISKGPDQ